MHIWAKPTECTCFKLQIKTVDEFAGCCAGCGRSDNGYSRIKWFNVALMSLNCAQKLVQNQY